MNVNVLIDAVVRQTMVLVAQLATAAGIRAPLAHVANQVFLDLVRELAAQGVGAKVIADMFGMALRTYHAKVQRLTESATDRGRTLWEAVLGHIQEKGTVARGDVLHRFRHDDDATVRGVLNDLVESGLVFRSGRGDRTLYRAADAEDLSAGAADEGDAAMVWVAVNRFAPASRQALAHALTLEEDGLDRALQSLLSDGRISAETLGGGEVVYTCRECVIPLGAPVGWEAAVFDHYQALVTAVCAKLRQGASRSRPADQIGGSTYGFDVWPGHPEEAEVLGLLRETRARVSALRTRVEAYNAGHTAPSGRPGGSSRVIFYLGQTVLEDLEDTTGGETT